jgi:putative FmdB family regulatory protein
MPLYDFHCLDCGAQFEALVLKTAASCPSCKSEHLEQLLSGFSVSSAATRESSLNGAKRKHERVRRDYSMDMQNTEKNHHH